MPRWMMPTSAAQALPGELQLIAAVLQQAVTDAQSPSPAIQQAARTFLTDAEQLRFWVDLAGLDAETFQQRVAVVLGRRGTA